MTTPKEHVKKALEANLSPQAPCKASTSPAERTLFQSWLAIPRRMRLVFSVILFGTAAAGLYISDKLGEKIPAQNPSTEKSSPSK